jgi:hypothetical protein
LILIHTLTTYLFHDTICVNSATKANFKEKQMKPKFTMRIAFVSIMVMLVLTLSACTGNGSAGDTGNAPAGTGSVGDSGNAPAAAAPQCPYGTWQITDFSGYMQSVAANIKQMSSDVTVNGMSTTGTATLTFNEDGTGSFIADNYVNNFTMSFAAGGTTMDIPIVLTQNGTSTAHYKVEGDQITFLDQDPGDLVITIDISGSSSNFDTSVLGTPGETQLYQFSCVDANSLSLKVTAVTNMDLAPILLTRVP